MRSRIWSGKTRSNLADSLPRVATGADHLPRYLKPEEIQRLIEAVRTDDAIGPTRTTTLDSSIGWQLSWY